MQGHKYLQTVRDLLARIEQTQLEKIEQAAGVIADAIADGGNLFATGVVHSALPIQDIFYRGGGLMLVNIIWVPALGSLEERPPTFTTRLEHLEGYGRLAFERAPTKAGDVLILVSTSGRNPVTIELGMAAKDAGLTVIGVTSMAYNEAVTSRHSSGKMIYETMDIVLDNLSVPGDAALEMEGVPQRFCPTSGIGSTAILQSLIAETIEQLAARGIEPPVYMPGNLDGGMEYNDRKLEEIKDRIFYL
jgi:uncharacterized phosphosugar-binding protein